METFDEIADALERMLLDLPEVISREDMEHHPGLRRIAVFADDINSRTEYRALVWAKTTHEPKF